MFLKKTYSIRNIRLFHHAHLARCAVQGAILNFQSKQNKIKTSLYNIATVLAHVYYTQGHKVLNKQYYVDLHENDLYNDFASLTKLILNEWKISMLNPTLQMGSPPYIHSFYLKTFSLFLDLFSWLTELFNEMFNLLKCYKTLLHATWYLHTSSSPMEMWRKVINK